MAVADTTVVRSAHTAEFAAGENDWRARLAAGQDPDPEAVMRAANPAYIPRNHRVEQAIAAARDEQDLQPMEDLLAVLADPYADHPEHAHLAQPPKPEEVVQRTFCGT